ncbi:MAG: antibiotic biosynthesis monooxygenase [Candidatus Limnocylindrales bacterium]
MPVIRINALAVPTDGGAELEERFRSRLRAVDEQPGFLGFDLLRPTGENEQRWFVMTRWESDEAFRAWVESPAFRHGHATSEGGARPVATGSELLEFDVVLSSST